MYHGRAGTQFYQTIVVFFYLIPSPPAKQIKRTRSMINLPIETYMILIGSGCRLFGSVSFKRTMNSLKFIFDFGVPHILSKTLSCDFRREPAIFHFKIGGSRELIY